MGFTVIEVKKDLCSAAVVKAAEPQLAGYVASRSPHTGQRFVGILTDGHAWRGYEMQGGELVEASDYELSARSGLTPLLAWLEGALATRKGVPPTPPGDRDPTRLHQFFLRV